MDRQPIAVRVPAPEELRESFEKLADQWENDTIFLSFSSQAAEHPAHREIVNMGKIGSPPHPGENAGARRALVPYAARNHQRQPGAAGRPRPC